MNKKIKEMFWCISNKGSIDAMNIDHNNPSIDAMIINQAPPQTDTMTIHQDKLLIEDKASTSEDTFENKKNIQYESASLEEHNIINENIISNELLNNGIIEYINNSPFNKLNNKIFKPKLPQNYNNMMAQNNYQVSKYDNIPNLYYSGNPNYKTSNLVDCSPPKDNDIRNVKNSDGEPKPPFKAQNY